MSGDVLVGAVAKPRLQLRDLRLPLRGFQLEVTLDCHQWPLVLLGPSGAGKTILLRLLAGLDPPEAGSVTMSGETWVDRGDGRMMDAHLRPVGYCIQDNLLFPHMSVVENVEFAAAGRRPPLDRKERRRAALEELGLVGAGKLAQDPVTRLSGGEQSRVALARALARRPALLLLDEPFAALDPASREELLNVVRRVLEERNIPTIWVTHDRNEALTLGGTLAVMMEGRIVQTGPSEEVFRRPSSPEVARFVGAGAILHGLVQARSAGVMRLVCGKVTLHAAGTLPPGTPVVVAIRSDEVELAASEAPNDRSGKPIARRPSSSARNEIAGVVTSVRPLGLQFAVDVDAGVPLTATVTKPALEDLSLAPGREVLARIKAVAVQVLSEAWKPADLEPGAAPGPNSAAPAEGSRGK